MTDDHRTPAHIAQIRLQRIQRTWLASPAPVPRDEAIETVTYAIQSLLAADLDLAAVRGIVDSARALAEHAERSPASAQPYRFWLEQLDQGVRAIDESQRLGRRFAKEGPAPILSEPSR